MQIHSAFIAALSLMIMLSSVDVFTFQTTEHCLGSTTTCRNTPCKNNEQDIGKCGPTLYCCSKSREETTKPKLNKPKRETEDENEVVPFLLTIRGEGTADSFHGLVEDIKTYLKTNGRIAHSRVDIQGPRTGNLPSQFLLSIKGKAEDAAIKRLVRQVTLFLKSDRTVTNRSLDLQGDRIDPKLEEFIEVINASLQHDGNGYSSNNRRRKKKTHLNLIITGKTTSSSLKRLVQEINDFFMSIGQNPYSSVTLQHQWMEVSPSQGDQRTLMVQVQGPEDSLSTVVQEMKALLRTASRRMNSFLDLKVQSPSEAAGLGLTVDSAEIRRRPSIHPRPVRPPPIRRHRALPSTGRESAHVSLMRGDGLKVDSAENCLKHLGICRMDPCDAKDKDLGKCGIGDYCCSISRDQSTKHLDVLPHDFESSPKTVSFILKSQGPDVAFNNLFQDLKAFLKTKGHITSTSMDIQGPETTGSPSQGNPTAQFVLSINHQETNTTLNNLIQAINASLKRHRIDIPPINGEKRPPFILTIQG